MGSTSNRRPQVHSPGGLSHQAEDEAKGQSGAYGDTRPRPQSLPNPLGGLNGGVVELGYAALS